MVDLIIGVDCATEPKRVGLARARRGVGGFEVTEAITCTAAKHPVEILTEWIGPEQRVLLALDAPLGWPTGMGAVLGSHKAGDPIDVPSEFLFRRLTDRFVAERTGKTPLDVGADRIARTAHAALRLLGHLRQELRAPIPLAWGSVFRERIEVIEVYPAATLLSRGASLRGYKHPAGIAERRALLNIMNRSLQWSSLDEGVASNVDCVDAIACVLGGLDFLEGRAVHPVDLGMATKEGWIWFAESGAGREFSPDVETTSLLTEA